METKNLLKKAFLLLALIGGASSAWAADETIFLWQSDGSTTTKGTAMTASGGTAEFNGASDKSPATESAAYNASVANDMKATGKNGHKFGTNTIYLKVSLTSKVLQEGDIIYVCGYNPYRIGSGVTENRANTDIAESLATGTSKTDYQVGSVTITASMITAMGDEVDEIYFSRANGTGTGVAAIKIVRPDQSKTASDLTLTSSGSVTLDPEKTSQITYTSSSTGAVTYTSSAEGVATVSSTGLITAVASGSATITVSQAEDATYRAGSKTVTVTVNKVRKATEVTGEFILDTTNGSQSSNVYTSNDGSVIIEAGTTAAGSGTYNDLKNSHFKMSGDCLFTLPTNYSVSTIWFVGYSNSDSDRAITLKEVDGVAVSPELSDNILKRNQTPGADCVGFEFASPATESIKINIAAECRGYFILNPAAKNIEMTQVGANYYATFYSAGEVTITGATAYTAEFDAENSKVVLTECAGGVVGGRTGVILIGNSATATATPSFTGAAKNQGYLIGVAEKAVAMANYYDKGSVADKVFVLGNDEGNVGLYKYTGSSLGVNKAYLYTEAFAGSSARSITFTFGDNITSINGVNAENVKAELKKFFENGRLVIEKEGKRFNAAGAKLY